MDNLPKHPLATILANPAEPLGTEVEDSPTYDPISQLTVKWVDINNHLEILLSGKSTGDPDTRSSTTEAIDGMRIGSDDDTDDSGT